MKKSPFVLFFFLLINVSFISKSYSQVAYYDAAKLRKLIIHDTTKVPDPPPAKTAHIRGDRFKNDQSSYDMLLSVLSLYTDSAGTHKNYKLKANVVNAYNSNPFIKDYLPGAALGSESISNSFFANISKSLSSAGGLDVTNIANGIADLMIERAKEELTVAFFNKFKDFAQKNPEFGILFPKTTTNLSNLLSYNYPQMLPALRSGFLDDLSKLTYNLDDVLTLPRYQNLLKNLPEVKIAVHSLRLVRELETGASNAADVFKEFSSFDEWNDDNHKVLENVGSLLKVTTLFSESIRNDVAKDNSRIWIKAEDLKQLFYDKMLFTIYMGLIYQQVVNNPIFFNDIKNDKKIYLKDILAQQTTVDNIFVFQNELKKFFDLTGRVNTAFSSIKSKIQAKQTPSNDDYYNYINVSIDVVDYGFGLATILKGLPEDSANKKPIYVYSKYISLARNSNSLYKDIYTKQYTQAVNDGLLIFSQIDSLANLQIDIEKIKAVLVNYSGSVDKTQVVSLAKSKSINTSALDEVVTDVANGKINNTDVQSLETYSTVKRLLDFIDKLKPYALFMANLVEAKDENAVKNALENVILPVGSSSIKKNTEFNISVQSYLGAYYAFNASTSVGVGSDKFGVTAPIGISLTPSFLSWKKGGAVSLFVPLFDLGAIVDYKLKKDSTSTTSGTTNAVTKSYSVKLGQIVSPGAYLVYGFGANLPLSFGFGGQYGPGLAKIDAGGGQLVSPYWRWSVYLAVDLPLFTLRNINKSK